MSVTDFISNLQLLFCCFIYETIYDKTSWWSNGRFFSFWISTQKHSFNQGMCPSDICNDQHTFGPVQHVHKDIWSMSKGPCVKRQPAEPWTSGHPGSWWLHSNVATNFTTIPTESNLYHCNFSEMEKYQANNKVDIYSWPLNNKGIRSLTPGS